MYPHAPANDDFFFVPRARNSPIKSSFRQVEGLPEKLKIFRIAGSKYWQVRIFNFGRYISRSLKTTDVHDAQMSAKAFYAELVSSGQVPSQKRAESIEEGADFHYLLHDLIEEILRREWERVTASKTSYSF